MIRFSIIKRIIVSILFLVIFQSVVFSQLGRMRRDGLWWSALDEPKKINYVLGYARGVFIGSGVVVDKYLKGSKCYKKAMSSIDSLKRQFLKVDLNYLIYRIDSLYRIDTVKADSSILGMMVFRSYWVIVNQLTGAPEKETEQMFLYLRREDSDRFKTFQELKDYKLPY